MAAVSLSRRALGGIVFIVAGALLLIAVALPLLGVASLPWLSALAYLGIAVGYAILGIGAVNANLAKITLVAAAVGWLVLAIAALVALPGPLVLVAALVAGIAGVLAGIVLYSGKEIRNLPAILLTVTAVVGLLFLLEFVGVFSLGTLGTVIALAFAIGLIVSGVLLQQRETRRG